MLYIFKNFMFRFLSDEYCQWSFDWTKNVAFPDYFLNLLLI